MQPTKTKKEWEIEFKKIYIQILKKQISFDELIVQNEMLLNQFKSEYTIDNNSIEFLPAYFNFIECFLAQNKTDEVKKYLIVWLTNLLNASKKKTSNNNINFSDNEEITKKLLQSRLDLLFGRFNILTRAPANETVDKITSSIITFSEIFGPENVGLTPQYYYLAEYFLDYSDIEEKKERMKRIIVKKIYSKIADNWKNYFMGNSGSMFMEDDNNTDLTLAIGETFVKNISNRIANVFPRDSEIELDLKFKLIRCVILKKNKSAFADQAQSNAIEFQNRVEDKILDKDFITDMNEIINYASDE